MTKAVIDDLREHAQELGCERELASLAELERTVGLPLEEIARKLEETRPGGSKP